MNPTNQVDPSQSGFNMQNAINTALEELSELFSDDQNFVPQSILWEKINEFDEIASLEADEKAKMYRNFLSSLVGKKNSLALFESRENPDNPLDVKWRIRPTNFKSIQISNDESPFSQNEEQQQIADLQKTLASLRRQSSKLEAENRQYMLVIEQLKLTASSEVQNDFNLFDSFHNYIQQSGQNLKSIENSMSTINQKIDDINQT